MVMVKPDAVTSQAVTGWKKEKFSSVVLLVDDATSNVEYQRAAMKLHEGSMPIYCFIEVGRSKVLADASPELMASLGMHDDWLARFPGVKMPGENQVAKVYPWVPIRYEAAFNAQLTRVKAILKRFDQDYEGVFLNDLQGGPASCGCGNSLCRWATDYKVPATGAKKDPITSSAEFLDGVLAEAWGKKVIPVWTTECENVDLPKDRHPNSTGLCGGVGCAVGTCPKEFRAQYAGMKHFQKVAPLGLLALHKALERTKPGGDGIHWISSSVEYLNTITGERQKPWIFVQGYDVPPDEEKEARKIAGPLAERVIVVRTPVDQSYEPRILPIKKE
jgi:hypothetical protein